MPSELVMSRTFILRYPFSEKTLIAAFRISCLFLSLALVVVAASRGLDSICFLHSLSCAQRLRKEVSQPESAARAISEAGTKEEDIGIWNIYSAYPLGHATWMDILGLCEP